MKATQAKKLAMVLNHGTFEMLKGEEASQYTYDGKGSPIYRFTPFDKINCIAPCLIQAATDPFIVINNIIDLYDLKA